MGTLKTTVKTHSSGSTILDAAGAISLQQTDSDMSLTMTGGDAVTFNNHVSVAVAVSISGDSIELAAGKTIEANSITLD